MMIWPYKLGIKSDHLIRDAQERISRASGLGLVLPARGHPILRLTIAAALQDLAPLHDAKAVLFAGWPTWAALLGR